MKKIRVAFVGLAHTHAPILGRAIREHIEDYEIVGFAEAPLPIPDMECYTGARALFKDEMGVKEYENWRDLLDVDLDLCIVNSTNASREEICCAFLDKGVHVLDEKPMATDYKGALHMCRSAKEHGVYMLTNWPIAWWQAFHKAKEIVESGRIGKLLRVTYRSPATWGPFSYAKDGRNPPPEVLKEKWWYKDEMGGGSVFDYACYGAMISTYVFGKRAERVMGLVKNLDNPELNVTDFSAMMLDFGDTVGLLEGSWVSYNPGDIPSGPVFYGTEGTIICDRRLTTVKIFDGRNHCMSEPTEIIDAGPDTQHAHFGEHLANIVRGIEKPHPMLTMEINLSVCAALDAGIQSSKTNIVTPLPPDEFTF